MKKQAGFTLVELVVVIAILGILAAVAIPRFADLNSTARESAIDNLDGAVRSAATLAHAQAVAENATGATGTITMEGTSVALVYGYPSTTGIANAMNSYEGFTFSSGTFTLQTNCTVQYTQAASSGAVPTYTKTTTGC